MRLGLVVGLLAVVPGCDSPAPLGLRYCGPDGECPVGQICVEGICGASPYDASPTDIATSDAAPRPECTGGDDRCLATCADEDPDCVTTCGDGQCIGNAGELCPTCATDCKTREIVCGNGQCEAGESPDCFADCGPAPWSWVALESDLLAAINAKRVGGHACPGRSSVTAPALTASMTMLPVAREWVWEIAHHEYLPAAESGVACNGRTLNDRAMQASFSYEANGRGYNSVAEAIDSWFTHAVICPRLMSTGYTQAATAVALDRLNVYLVLLR